LEAGKAATTHREAAFLPDSPSRLHVLQGFSIRDRRPVMSDRRSPLLRLAGRNGDTVPGFLSEATLARKSWTFPPMEIVQLPDDFPLPDPCFG
jgi:hypothetical protein